MGIINELVLVETNRRVGGMYKKMGYEPFEITNKRCRVMVLAEDVFKNAKVDIRVQCDYCGNIYTISKHLYTAAIKMCHTKKWACHNCSKNKMMESCMDMYGCHFTQLDSYKENRIKSSLEKYGTEYPMQSDIVKEHQKETMLNKYGVEYAGQIESGKEKAIQTNLEKYGVPHSSKLKEIQDKKRATVRERYNVDHVMKLDSTKQKIKETCLERFGVDQPMKSPEIRQKANETYYKNGTGHCSNQQYHIWEVVGGELNYPVSGYSLDIAMDGIDIEYNGSGHDLCVQTGQKSREDFDKKERMRKGCLKKNDYKILNIDSKTDKLPDDNTIKYIVNSLVFFLNNFDDREISIDLDTFEITTST